MWKALPCSKLFDFEEIALEHDVIGIDEGQFVRISRRVHVAPIHNS